MCRLLGWRWTFWFCAAADAVLFVGSIIYVPETLAIPPEARPKLKLTSMFKPLTELQHKEVGLMCLLGGVNHGVLYVTMITIPQIMALLTDDEFVIGLMVSPKPQAARKSSGRSDPKPPRWAPDDAARGRHAGRLEARWQASAAC